MSSYFQRRGNDKTGPGEVGFSLYQGGVYSMILMPVIEYLLQVILWRRIADIDTPDMLYYPADVNKTGVASYWINNK
ncbi:hypothetical protein [Enterobacter sp. SORGH_AS_0287]|uniref:hypothetical protein n=1 Tax=Enterobacter sp. SORGH_AS_0287 TaxID=3041779 RepID=UPI002857935A|nr:hypothetical protein [Enterobacter sp. SORGH_AS_0287]MDR6367008.1 hypothetical protein [Enterobacter sp. SORGH_AS_0287]